MISQILVKGSVFFLSPLYARLMTQAEYGVTSVFIGAVSIFSIIIGLQTYGSLNNAKTDFSSQEQSQYRSSILGISIVSFFVVFTAVLFLKDILSFLLNLPVMALLLACIAAFGSFCVMFLNSQYTADEHPGAFLLVSVSNTLVNILMSFVLISCFIQGKHWGRILAITLTDLFFGIVIIFIVLKKGKVFYHKHYWVYCMPLVLPLVFHALAGQVLAQNDLLMINKMMGEDQAAIYSFAHTMGLPLNAIWTAFNATWVPIFYRKLKGHENHELIQIAKSYNVTYTTFTCGFILICFEVYKLLAPQSYWSGKYIVLMVALCSHATFLYSFAANYEFYCKRTKMISFATIMAATLNGILNYLLIPSFGLMGAATATLISYLMLVLFHEYVARTIVGKYIFPIYISITSAVVVVCITLFTVFFENFWGIRWSVATLLGVFFLIRTIKTKSII